MSLIVEVVITCDSMHDCKESIKTTYEPLIGFVNLPASWLQVSEYNYATLKTSDRFMCPQCLEKRKRK